MIIYRMLSERRHNVLQSLIQEYVQSAHPVGSTTLVARYLPRVSSATVRNELMWLEDQGYATSPHTSAGRVPTNIGYRTFVNSLLLHPGILGSNQSVDYNIDNQDNNKPSMANLVNINSTIDKATLINEVLSFASTYTNNLMVFWAPQISATVFHRGLPLLLSQPEFSNIAAALPIMQLLESNGELLEILKDVAGVGGLHIKIGAENSDTQLYQFSMVSMRFDAKSAYQGVISNQTGSNIKGTNFGVIALFGPTRMDYQKAIGTVCAIADDLERTIS
jgi:transcriptional regulator of heat shock response